MTSGKKRQALICGGGPSGLATAIMLHQQGWDEIVLVERRKTHNTFERGKAFNYQLDGRGQQMLAHIGLDETAIQSYGIANTVSVFNSFGPDGEEKSITVPFVLKEKQTAYWMTRSALLDMLHQRVQTVNTDGRIRLLYDHSFEGLQDTGDQTGALIKDGTGIVRTLQPQLILGCDGVNSLLRRDLAAHPLTDAKDFEMQVTPSPSSDLMYKVIRLPKNMAVAGRENAVTDHRKSYIFTSTYTDFHERLSLFSLPVARASEQRSANIILPQSHKFWDIRSADEMTAYLKKGFPQLDIDQVIPPEEIEDFIQLKTGKFPHPQYSPKVHADITLGDAQTTCVILGDAAHGFPPDLGLGVNSALQDVYLFGQELAAEEADLSAAATRYETARLPESRALVRLVKNVFPYQYNHVPWRFKLSMAKFLGQLGLSKITGGMIDQPGFRLCQNERLSYTALERRIAMTDATFYTFLVGLLAGASYLATRLF